MLTSDKSDTLTACISYSVCVVSFLHGCRMAYVIRSGGAKCLLLPWNIKGWHLGIAPPYFWHGLEKLGLNIYEYNYCAFAGKHSKY